MAVTLNRSVAAYVHLFDGAGELIAGSRFDVDPMVLERQPGLAAFVVMPSEPLHDFGSESVKLLAATVEEIQAVAEPTGCPWSMWLEVDEA